MAKAKAEVSEKAPSRMSMVRTALDTLGMDATPGDIQTHIKTNFNVELPTQVISNYKFQIRTKAGKPGPGRGRRSSTSVSGLRVEDFELLRGLVDRLGAEQVRQMVKVVE